MTNEMKAAIKAMQTKRAGGWEIRQNANGTWSHHKDGQREWTDRAGCEIDLRFHREWEAA